MNKILVTGLILKLKKNVFFSEFVTEDGLPVTNNNNLPTLDNRESEVSSTTNRPTCAASKTVVQGYSTVCQGNLIFSEDFDKTKLEDLKNWDAEIMFPRGPVSIYKTLFNTNNAK